MPMTFAGAVLPTVVVVAVVVGRIAAPESRAFVDCIAELCALFKYFHPVAAALLC